MILALAGGVGGARLAVGLAQHLSARELAIVVNTGDDFEHLGLAVSPDIDTALYTLSDLVNEVLGTQKLVDFLKGQGVMNANDLGIASTATKIFARVSSDAFGFAALAGVRVPAAAQAIWPSFVELMAGLETERNGWPGGLDEARSWYQPVLEERYPDAAIRAADLDQLAQIAKQYASRERFLTELTLDPPDATSDEAGAPLLDEDYLILSTIHSAKGQEWRSVFVLNVVDGCIPSDMSTGRLDDIEEERRLLYVAMTRAKDDLHLIMPQRFYVHQQRRGGDRHVYAARSRFIASDMLDHFEATRWPARAPDGAAVGEAASVAGVDLKARIQTMWKTP